VIRQLAAEAGSLYTAKWEPRIGPNHAIDETAAGLNLARYFFRVFGVSAPDTGTKPKTSIVGNMDRLLLIRGGDYSSHGAE
jgi:hypothetical protein